VDVPRRGESCHRPDGRLAYCDASASGIFVVRDDGCGDCFRRMFVDPSVAALADSTLTSTETFWVRAMLATLHGPREHVLVANKVADVAGNGPMLLFRTVAVRERRGIAPDPDELARRLQFFTGAVPTPAFYVDCELRYRFANHACLTWLARKHEDVIGLEVREVEGVDAYQRWGGYLATALEGEPVHCEREFICADNDRRWGRVSYIPDIEADGSVAGTLAVIHDLTDTRETRQYGGHRERERPLTMDNVPAPIAYLTTQKVYSYINHAMETWVGKPRHAVVGHCMEDVVPAEQKADVRSCLARACLGERVFYEHRFAWADGSEHCARTSFAPDFDAEGRLLGIFVVLTDLTEHKQVEAALAAREKHFRMITDGLPAPVVYVDRQWIYRFVNRQFPKWMGKRRDEIEGRSVREVVSPEQLAFITPYVERALSGEQVSYERTFTWPDGSLHPAEVTFVPDVDDAGQVCGIFGVMHDLTEIRAMEAALAASEKHFRMITDGLPAPVVYVDGQWIYRFVNRQFPKWMGKRRDEIEGRSVREVVSPETLAFITPYVERALSGEQVSYERTFTWPDGSLHPATLTLTPDVDSGGQVCGIFGVMHDLTEIRALEGELRAQATRDGLTGLANRRLFQDRLQMAVARARRADSPLALMFIDLDGFKQVNDTLGHEAGDQLLIEVARRFRSCVRESDTLARLGGDEFTIILEPVRAPENADLVARKLLAALDEPIVLGNASTRISASIGVSVYPFDGGDADALVKQADAAMYHAKRLGKSRHVASSRMS
jgi:diguanylate cyclase (GGDEF)-like protein/PAS domain S-box-containing protein